MQNETKNTRVLTQIDDTLRPGLLRRKTAQDFISAESLQSMHRSELAAFGYELRPPNRDRCRLSMRTSRSRIQRVIVELGCSRKVGLHVFNELLGCPVLVNVKVALLFGHHSQTLTCAEVALAQVGYGNLGHVSANLGQVHPKVCAYLGHSVAIRGHALRVQDEALDRLNTSAGTAAFFLAQVRKV